MSWAINFIGIPEKINKAIDDYFNQLTSPSKEEFEKVVPHLKNLISLNANSDEKYTPVLKITANGHAYSNPDGIKYIHCNVHIEQAGCILV